MENKFSLKISSIAKNDIDSIVAWYQEQSFDAGIKFITEIEYSLNKIVNSPNANSVYRDNLSVRRFSMKVFPYLIFYHFDSFHVEIIAIIHTSRSSAYIERRLK